MMYFAARSITWVQKGCLQPRPLRRSRPLPTAERSETIFFPTGWSERSAEKPSEIIPYGVPGADIPYCLDIRLASEGVTFLYSWKLSPFLFLPTNELLDVNTNNKKMNAMQAGRETESYLFLSIMSFRGNPPNNPISRLRIRIFAYCAFDFEALQMVPPLFLHHEFY